jgi:uncharacterized membrane protein YdjX (TVP38/TMEM64 family)
MSTTADSLEPAAWMKKLLRIGGAAALVALFVASFFVFPVVDILEDFVVWVQGFGRWGAVVFGLGYVFASVLFVPGTLITLAAGFAFGLLWGTLIVSVASTVAAGVSLLLGRFVARRWVAERVERFPRMHALMRAIDRDSFKVVLLSRLVPIFPFSVLNYGFSVTGVGFWRYLLASWLGMLPATVVYVYIGSVAGNLARILTGEAEFTPLQDALFVAGGLAALFVAVLLTRRAHQELEEITARAEAEDSADASETLELGDEDAVPSASSGGPS